MMFYISHCGFGTLLSFCVSFSYKCGMKTKVVNQLDLSLDLGLLWLTVLKVFDKSKYNPSA